VLFNLIKNAMEANARRRASHPARLQDEGQTLF
jgi:hypothetical protein